MGHSQIDNSSIEHKRGLVTRNLQVGDRRTSVRLEPLMWVMYDELVKREHCTQREISEHVHEISTLFGINFTAALRSYITRYYYSAATEQGHLIAGHGTLPRHKAQNYEALHKNMWTQQG